MNTLVLLLLEIEIVNDGLQLCLLCGVAIDTNFELSPTFIAANEWRFGVSCMSTHPVSVTNHTLQLWMDVLLTLRGVLESRMQVVDDLGEDIGRLLVASLVKDEEADAPFSHGKLRNRRRLVT